MFCIWSWPLGVSDLVDFLCNGNSSHPVLFTRKIMWHFTVKACQLKFCMFVQKYKLLLPDSFLSKRCQLMRFLSLLLAYCQLETTSTSHTLIIYLDTSYFGKFTCQSMNMNMNMNMKFSSLLCFCWHSAMWHKVILVQSCTISIRNMVHTCDKSDWAQSTYPSSQRIH